MTESTASSIPPAHNWREELRDLMRGVGGAAIIGVPLVYTMEVWQGATILSTGNILELLFFGFAANVGYNFVSGFRKGGGLISAMQDAIEALAIGAVFATVLLALLGIIGPGSSLTDAVCKIALETVPLSIGASIANTQFDGGQTDRDAGDTPGDGKRAPWREIGIAGAGALVLASSVAPTEEVALIAQRASPLGIAVIALFSLLLSYGMIFVADFTGSARRRTAQGILQSPVGETVLSYAVALVISLVSVYFFHGVSFRESPYALVALTVSLGLPAAIGGAAGRLLV